MTARRSALIEVNLKIVVIMRFRLGILKYGILL